MTYRNPWIYIEITCIKCAKPISNGHVRNAHSFVPARKTLMKEAAAEGAVLDKETGEVTCIQCLTPMREWPRESGQYG